MSLPASGGKLPPARRCDTVCVVIIWRRKSNLWLLVRRPLAFWRIYRPALLIMLVGGLLDGVTTLCVLHRYGPDAELHPAMWLVASCCGRLANCRWASGQLEIWSIVIRR